MSHQSYPTPESAARIERMGPHFAKFHLPGSLIHLFTEPDTGPPHDHPWPFISHVLAGGYTEEVYTLHEDGTHTCETIERLPGSSHRVEASTVHRIIDLPAGLCITRVEPGPYERTSGFYRFDDAGIWRRDWDKEWKLVTSKREGPHSANE